MGDSSDSNAAIAAVSSSGPASLHAPPTLQQAEDEDEPPSSGPRLPRTRHLMSNNDNEPSMNNRSNETAELSNPVDNESLSIIHMKQEPTHQILEVGDGAAVDASATAPKHVHHRRHREKAARRPRPSRFAVVLSRLRVLFAPPPGRDLGPNPTYMQSFVATVRYTPLNFCLLFIPIGWALHYTHQSPTLVFVFSALGIVPLAALLGFGTEQIALRTSQSVGGLLNATLGNVLEMIIAGIALKKCELELVQSSLLGGLLSNLLLVLGMAFIVGGYRFPQQEFQPMVAQLNSSLMVVAVIALIVPAAFHEYLGDRLPQGTEIGVLLQLSRGSSIVLIFIYLAYLVFQFYSHNHLFLDTTQSSYSSSSSSGSSRDSCISSSSSHFATPTITARSSLRHALSEKEQIYDPEQGRHEVDKELPPSAAVAAGPAALGMARTTTGSSHARFVDDDDRGDVHSIAETVSSHSSSSSMKHDVRRMNTPSAFLLLIATTAFAYVTAENLVDSLHGLVEDHPSISREWLTLIVIPIISNAAEHTTAVVVAHKGKFDLAMSVAVGSCIQIALFVIPMLILVAWRMGKPLTLLFDELETLVLFFSVILVKFSIEDGRSHWMSGMALVCEFSSLFNTAGKLD
ncbi:hypothetical protein HGRIS_014533 [Hohenbuehelia grisea]|uniref:Sodium/calcium exchanger membrane region domain-containing protein n=1 Tax=Hohenbuehelia grisea TaxID=104357 RepID=A0ABR3JVW7_9AGAR